MSHIVTIKLAAKLTSLYRVETTPLAHTTCCLILYLIYAFDLKIQIGWFSRLLIVIETVPQALSKPWSMKRVQFRDHI